MKAEQRHALQENSLAHGVESLVDRAKTGRLVSYRVAGVVLLVAFVGGIWWYLARQHGKVTSAQWTAFLLGNVPEDKASAAARAERLDQARRLFGPDGVAQLQQREPDKRTKGVENVEKAREEFLKLADEYKGDVTLQASCLLDAAEAELALVGIPRDATKSEFRGTVAKAAEYLRKAADVAGKDTPFGEQEAKRADDLVAKQQAVVEVATKLNTMIAPNAAFGGPSPDAPKPPTGPVSPIGPPTPPEGSKPAEGVKPPTGPVQPPSGPAPTNPPPVSPPTAPPATPPAAPPAAPPATPPAPPAKAPDQPKK